LLIFLLPWPGLLVCALFGRIGASQVRLDRLALASRAIREFQMELLADYAGWITSLISDIDGTRVHAHLLFYIFADDSTGRSVASRASPRACVPPVWTCAPFGPSGCSAGAAVASTFATIARSRTSVALLYAARKTIVITTPYFIPDESFLQALRTAATRGVAVHLVVSKHAN
jgi:phosphatidylserine/phosphatidylglycerophosphate/cardiolipin synthase-like enzyme